MALKPGSVVGAALADLRLATRKRERRARLTASERCAPYAFHRAHVGQAHSAAELIGLALRDRALGLGSGKAGTRLLYGDAGLLQAALAAATGDAA